MKRAAIYALVLFTALLMAWALVPDSAVKAEQTLFYSCSYQVYEAFDKEKIEAFTKATGIKVNVSRASSPSAVYRLMYGYSDVASTSRELYAQHKDYGFTMIPFCKDPLAVITSADCGVDSLTEDQLQEIFSGDIKNWKEVGGPDLPILVIVPGTETAANKNFRRQVMKQKEIAYNFMTYDSTMAIEAVKYFPCGSVSFIGGGAVAHQKEIKTLKVNGLLPIEENYPYYQIFYYITKGEPKGAVKQFIDFSFSDVGQAIMKKNGMVPLHR